MRRRPIFSSALKVTAELSFSRRMESNASNRPFLLRQKWSSWWERREPGGEGRSKHLGFRYDARDERNRRVRGHRTRRTQNVELQCAPSPALSLPRQPLAALHSKRS